MSSWRPIPGDWVDWNGRVFRVVQCPELFSHMDGPSKVWTVDPVTPDDQPQWLSPAVLTLASPEQIQAAQLASLTAGGL